MNARVLIDLEDIRLSFGGKPLFDELNLHVCAGDKICLVGKNGAGKTTLMRLITGALEADAGKRFCYPGLSIGYLAQQVTFDERQTVTQFVMTGLAPEKRDESHQHLAHMMMQPLDLDEHATMATLSGGQVRRASLARALLAEPELLLLDEPTNHLDLVAIEWLENYLARYRGALVCVSHDRAFLTAISRKVFWIDHGKVRTCPKGYGEFDAWMEEIVEHEAKALQNMQKKLDAEIDWTQGGVTARRKRNQRRMNELNRLRDKLKNDKAAYKQRMAAIEIESLPPAQASKIIAEFKGVSKRFVREDGKTTSILRDFNIRVQRGDRIGIVGRNGSGKSTFIKLLTGEIAPDVGRVRLGKTVDITYFDQHRSLLNPNKTLWDTLAPDGSYVFLGHGQKQRHIHVCGYLKNFLFDPKLARDKVGTLSGGQQNRLLLAKALATPGNVLILDEPTNDLDMDTLDMLQEILVDYQGTLILVSHDRDFLDRTVTEILAFEGDGIIEAHLGGYSDYARAKGKLQPAVSSSISSAKKKKAEQKNIAHEQPESLEPTTSLTTLPKARMPYKFVVELEKLSATLARLETEIASFSAELADPTLYTRDPDRFDKASRRIARAQAELVLSESRWLELEEMKAQYL
jgi:ATP-binding cassette subfamily F protein uup